MRGIVCLKGLFLFVILLSQLHPRPSHLPQGFLITLTALPAPSEAFVALVVEIWTDKWTDRLSYRDAGIYLLSLLYTSSGIYKLKKCRFPPFLTKVWRTDRPTDWWIDWPFYRYARKHLINQRHFLSCGRAIAEVPCHAAAQKTKTRKWH